MSSSLPRSWPLRHERVRHDVELGPRVLRAPGRVAARCAPDAARRGRAARSASAAPSRVRWAVAGDGPRHVALPSTSRPGMRQLPVARRQRCAVTLRSCSTRPKTSSLPTSRSTPFNLERMPAAAVVAGRRARLFLRIQRKPFVEIEVGELPAHRRCPGGRRFAPRGEPLPSSTRTRSARRRPLAASRCATTRTIAAIIDGQRGPRSARPATSRRSIFNGADFRRGLADRRRQLDGGALHRARPASTKRRPRCDVRLTCQSVVPDSRDRAAARRVRCAAARGSPCREPVTRTWPSALRHRRSSPGRRAPRRRGPATCISCSVNASWPLTCASAGTPGKRSSLSMNW